MKVHDQSLPSAVANTTTIVRMDDGLAVAIIDDHTTSSSTSINSPQSQTAQLLLTTPTRSSLSPTSSSILLATPSGLSRLISSSSNNDAASDIDDHHHCLQIIHNGSAIHPDAINHIATSTTTSNVIIHANGTFTSPHHLDHQPQHHHHHQNNLIATSSAALHSTTATTTTVLINDQEDDIDQSCPTTTPVALATSSNSSSTAVPVTTDIDVAVTAARDILHIITPTESQTAVSVCYTDNPLSIEIKDNIFDDDSNGYPDNAAVAAAAVAASAAVQQATAGGGGISGGINGSSNGGGAVSISGGGYIPLLPPVGSGTVGSGGGGNGGIGGTPNPDQTDLKYYFEELCPVCGDKVSGYHYGLLTCESCKGFFKRTVQNKKVYTCVAERQCHIDKTQRKRCPFCRFQKCLEVGMKLEAVRADRMRGGRNKFGPMYKRDRARKLQIMRQRQLALQALRASESGGAGIGGIGGSSSGGGSNSSQLSPTGYQQSAYSHMNIKQEIQIPQISSLTSSSPDSSPSPIAIALGQVSATSGGGGGGGSTTTALSLSGSTGGGGGSGSSEGGGGSSGNSNGGGMSGGNGSSANGGSANGNGSSNSMNATNLTANNSSGSIQNTTTDSKLWFANSTTASPHSLSPKQFSFDTASNPTSTEDTGSGTVEPLSKKQYWKNSKSLNFPRVSPMIREFVQTVDDREWQTQLFSLLQSQSYNQCEVDLFELMCKVLDQNLFSQVDWARNTVFFKDLKVDDQMKLLQNSWSDMLVLDHLHQRIHNNLPDETTLHNGQKFDLLGLGLLGVPQLSDHFNEIQNKLQELKFDVGDYICMKFLLLLNPDVRGITNRKTVEEGYGNVQAALLDYTLTCYPSVTDKFSKLRSIIPEIHAMAARGEEHLYIKHCAGSAPTQTLLMEMLHAKRK